MDISPLSMPPSSSTSSASSSQAKRGASSSSDSSINGTNTASYTYQNDLDQAQKNTKDEVNLGTLSKEEVDQQSTADASVAAASGASNATQVSGSSLHLRSEVFLPNGLR
jgi:hypothetical protein